MLSRGSRSLFTLNKFSIFWPSPNKRNYLVHHVNLTTRIVGHGDASDGDVQSVIEEDPNASATSVKAGGYSSFPVVLSEDAVAQLVSDRNAFWVQNNLLHWIADAMRIEDSKVKHFVKKYPTFALFNERNFIKLFVANRQTGKSKEKICLPEVEHNLKLVCSRGIEVHRIHASEWIWAQKNVELVDRLKIKMACPEVLAVICSYSSRMYGPLRHRMDGTALTWKFNEIHNMFCTYIGTTDSYELVHYLQRHSFILWLPTDRLQRFIEMMLENGVSPDQIRRDLWVLRHNIGVAAKRLAQAQKAGLTVIKPWMLRCPEEAFKKHLELVAEHHAAIAPHQDVRHYLAARLKCDVEVIDRVGRRHPQVLRIRPPKLVQTFDYLFEGGYKPEEVR